MIEKMIKQRRESIAQYEKAARKDPADAENSSSTCCGYLLSR